MVDWQPRQVGVDITEHYVASAIVPVLWLMTAAVLGAFRQAQMRENAALRAEAERLAQANEMLAAEIERMDASVTRLELQAVAAERDGFPPQADLGSLNALAAAREKDLPALFYRAAFCMPGQAVLFLARSDGLLGVHGPAPAWLTGLVLIDGRDRLIGEIARQSDGVVVEARSFGGGIEGYLACCAIETRADEPCGLVVAHFADDAAAAANLNGVVMLARLCAAALRREMIEALLPLEGLEEAA
jgi:hypothetical protein